MNTIRSAKDQIQALLDRLNDPARSQEALLALLSQGRCAVPALAGFLRSSKPSTVAEPRLLAVEGLDILKSGEALEALIEVATERLEEISDPVVRLAEETVASRAALALADFDETHARATLLRLLHRKPLAGVAEAFEKLRDDRAIPYLTEWLEDDFVSEPASRAILACGAAAVTHLLASLQEKKTRYESETGMSQRRRARILEILADPARAEDVAPVEYLLQDPAECVRLNAVQLFLRCGALPQKLAAYHSGLTLLDSRDNAIHSTCQELLVDYFHLGSHFVQKEIDRRRALGESEEPAYPRETTLAILIRIARGCGEQREQPL
jgi:hypothetical protein